MRAESEFDVTGLDQAPYGDQVESSDEDSDSGPNLAGATVLKTFRGDLEGTSTAELLMCQADKTDLAAGAGYVASEVFNRELSGKCGSFVTQHWGLSGSGMDPKTSGHVIPGSGTDELVGLTGSIEIAVSSEGKHTWTMEYELPDSD